VSLKDSFQTLPHFGTLTHCLQPRINWMISTIAVFQFSTIRQMTYTVFDQLRACNKMSLLPTPVGRARSDAPYHQRHFVRRSKPERCSRAWGSHASRVLSEPSRRGLQPTKFFPPNGENKEGDTSVWRDAKHHTPEACAPLFNCIVPAKSEYQKQVTDPTRDGLRMCVGEAAHLLRSSAACSPEIASSKTISVDPVCVS